MDRTRRVWTVLALLLAVGAAAVPTADGKPRTRVAHATATVKLRAVSAVAVPVKATCVPVRVTLKARRGRAATKRIGRRGTATLRVRATLGPGRHRLRFTARALRRPTCSKLLRVGRPKVRKVSKSAAGPVATVGAVPVGAAGATGVAVLPGATSGGAGSVPGVDPCTDVAAPGGAALPPGGSSRAVPLGTAVSAGALAGGGAYTDALASRFDSLTAENETKMDALRAQPDRWNWGPAESLVAYGAATGKAVRGHALVWHEQLPAWFESRTWTPDTLRTYLRDYVTTAVCHFRGRIHTWDLVNEPLAAVPVAGVNDLRPTIFRNLLGPGYIAEVFRWAHAADPGAALFLNDFNTEFGRSAADATLAERARAQLRVVQGLLAQGVPISGVGFQVHNDSRFHRVTESEIASALQDFTSLGLQVAITEMDVSQPPGAGGDEDARAADVFGAAARACRAVAGCTAFGVWGVDDGHSWLGAAARPTLLDAGYQPKPAYAAVDAALR